MKKRIRFKQNLNSFITMITQELKTEELIYVAINSGGISAGGAGYGAKSAYEQQVCLCKCRTGLTAAAKRERRSTSPCVLQQQLMCFHQSDEHEQQLQPFRLRPCNGSSGTTFGFVPQLTRPSPTLSPFPRRRRR